MVAALVALGLGVEVAFAALDARAPSDPERAWTHLPVVYARLSDLGHLPGAAADAVSRAQGIVELGLAGALRLFGRSPALVRAAGIVAWGVLLASVAWTGWRRAGPFVAAGAVAVLLGVPGLSEALRAGRPTFPEAALVALTLAAWARSPGLERPIASGVLAALGAVVLLHRETGLLWIGALAPVVFVGALAGPERRWGRAIGTLGLWALAARPALGRLLEWPPLGHPRLDFSAGDLLDAAVATVGWPALVLAAFAGVVSARHLRSIPAIGFAMGACIAAPLVLHALWRVGLDTFAAGLVCFALAMPAALGRVRPLLALAPLLAAAWQLAPQAVSPEALRAFGDVAATEATSTSITSVYRPARRWGGATVAALLDATCPSDAWRSCRIVVEQGLFRPASHEFGLHELFLLAEDRVELRTVYDRPGARWRGARVDALALYRCPGLDDRWRARAPDSTQLAMEVADAAGLREAWSGRVDPICTFHWLTPKGAFAHPEALADLPVGEPVEPWTPRLAWAELRAFRERHPSVASQHGRLPVRLGDDPFAEGPPAGWTEADSAAERVRAHAALPSPRAREWSSGRRPD